VWEPYGADRASKGHITPEKNCKRCATWDNQLSPDPIHADRGGVRNGKLLKLKVTPESRRKDVVIMNDSR